MFSWDELKNIAAAASTVDERLRGDVIPLTGEVDCEIAKRRLALWCEIATNGDENLLLDRVKEVGYDEHSLLPLLGNVCLHSDRKWPSWVKTFEWISHLLGSPSSFGMHNGFNRSDQLPFQDLFETVTEEAWARCVLGSSRIAYEETAIQAFKRDLTRRLTQISAPTLFNAFTAFRYLRNPLGIHTPENKEHGASNGLYLSFLKELRSGALRSMFQRFPVLARILATTTENWIDSISTLLSCLNEDLDLLSQEFNGTEEILALQNVNCSLSDLHAGGKAVTSLSFNNGLTIIYKPKDLSIDVAWNRLIAWLEKNGATAFSKPIKTVQRDGYGWVEHVSEQTCCDPEISNMFIQNAGSLLCWLYILQGTDFHFENVVANKECPIPVDLETLLHPWVKGAEGTLINDEASRKAEQFLRESVLSTGYLPSWTVLPDGSVESVGGLNLPGNREVDGTNFEDVNLDTMSLTRSVTELEIQGHIPKSTTSTDSDKFIRLLQSGFTNAYKFAMRHKSELLSADGPLFGFKGLQNRAIFRPTGLYDALQKRANLPQYLINGVDWSIQFDFLSRFEGHGVSTRFSDPVLAAERKSLCLLDIPAFYSRTHSRSLYSHDQVQLKTDCFRRTSISQVMERVSSLSFNKLESQLVLIHESLSNMFAAEGAGSQASWDDYAGEILYPETAIQIAESIAATLLHSGFFCRKKAAWIGAIPLGHDLRRRLEVVGADLYSGSSGIALFFAACYRVTEKTQYLDVVKSCLNSLLCNHNNTGFRRKQKEIGVATGLASQIYCWLLIGKILDDTQIVEQAVQIANLITEELITRDTSLDVMSGAAGGILGLSQLFEVTNDKSVLSKMHMCGQHLIDSRVEIDSGIFAWNTIQQTPLAGFSHGAAGIAYSLLRLYNHSENPKYLEAARDGFSFENLHFNVQQKNWPDFRTDTRSRSHKYLSQWCHGSAGIGLTRIGASRILGKLHFEEDIEAAVVSTLNYPIGPWDHLCCGNFGRLELLFTAGRYLGNDQLINVALFRAALLCRRYTQQRGFRWQSGTDAQNPAFFTGISGIGYELLRLTHPEMFPSVLLWE